MIAMDEYVKHMLAVIAKRPATLTGGYERAERQRIEEVLRQVYDAGLREGEARTRSALESDLGEARAWPEALRRIAALERDLGEVQRDIDHLDGRLGVIDGRLGAIDGQQP